MRFNKFILLLLSHGLIGVLGFAVGIYMLPILTAPPSPTQTQVQSIASQSTYSGLFKKELKGSDAFHWGEGEVFVGPDYITLQGRLAPGPDYRLYLSPEFVETEKDFNRLKSRMVEVSDIKTFENFIVSVPSTINPEEFSSVIVWCESFEEFITAAQYR